MHNNMILRCSGQIRPWILRTQRATRLGYSGLATQYMYQHQSYRFLIPNRQFSSLPPGPPGQSHEPPSQSLDAKAQTQHPQGQPPRKQASYKSWILFNLAGLSAVIVAAVVLKSAASSGNSDKKIINKTSFSPFTIISKEQVSPTAFILSVRAGSGATKAGGSTAQTTVFREAWDHGLWSVEIKQPQLQIARHYTPLPSLGGNVDGGDDVLRFLVRKVDGGEMSTYLSKLRVGEAVWLRGPHLGFDVEKRLGDAGQNVVFVAGGTGIAPALQVAQQFLDGPSNNSDGKIGEADIKPTIYILWANRRAADALGRQQHHTNSTKGETSNWFTSLWRRADETPSLNPPETQAEESSFSHQIQDLEQRHPNHFQISYFVDEERNFINALNLRDALLASGSRQKGSAALSPLTPPTKTCPWHSPRALAKLPDDDDFGRRDLECKCRVQHGGLPPPTANAVSVSAGAGVGANLVCVSGPDGFVEAMAGPKRWYAGTEMQGPVRGALGRLLGMDGDGDGGKVEVRGNWLVLKL